MKQNRLTNLLLLISTLTPQQLKFRLWKQNIIRVISSIAECQRHKIITVMSSLVTCNCITDYSQHKHGKNKNWKDCKTGTRSITPPRTEGEAKSKNVPLLQKRKAGTGRAPTYSTIRLIYAAFTCPTETPYISKKSTAIVSIAVFNKVQWNIQITSPSTWLLIFGKLLSFWRRSVLSTPGSHDTTVLGACCHPRTELQYY